MLFLIAFGALLAWLSLAFFRGGFWRGRERLTDAPAPAQWPHVVALVPARDEAETIAAAVSAHLGCDYPGALTLIVADDNSTDGTAALAISAAQKKHKSKSVEIVSVPPLPAGWTGKLWALENALARAKELAPNAPYVLLTDADILLAPSTLTRLVAKAEGENLAMASLMARLDSRGPWASFLIPAFIYFFAKLYPFSRANDPNDNLAAAAGGCILVRRSALNAIGGFGAVRGALIDDCSLAAKIKDLTPGTRIWLGLADDEATSLRDNRSLQSIWNMVARTAYAQLHYSPFLLVGTLAGLALVYLAAPLIILTVFYHGAALATLMALAACLLMGYTYWPTLRLYNRAPWETALLPVAAALYGAMTFSSAWRHWRGRGGQWKGRQY